MEIAKKICIQMLIQRHWIVDEHKSSNIDDIIDIDHSSGDPAIDYFTGMTAPLLVNTEITKEPEHYIVFMLSGVKLNIANVKECIKILDQIQSKYCIIIYNNNITSSAKRVLNNFVDVVFEGFEVRAYVYLVVLAEISRTDAAKLYFRSRSEENAGHFLDWVYTFV